MKLIKLIFRKDDILSSFFFYRFLRILKKRLEKKTKMLYNILAINKCGCGGTGRRARLRL